MVEVLITILVVSLGLFGILAVVINSLKLSSSSTYRTIAAQQATALAEAIRANPTTLAYDDTVVLTAADCSLQLPGICSFSRPSTIQTSASTDCFKQAGVCDRSTLANTLYWGWRTNLQNLLPGGDGTICRDNDPAAHKPTNAGGVWNFTNCSGGTGDQVVIKVCWGESNIQATRSTFLNGMMCSWTAL